jgi:hypothetical protein
MCFSTEASLAVAAALVPAGAYTVGCALRKNRAYLMAAAMPLLFGLQQVGEAGVWAGLEYGAPDLVKPASLAFLFFAIALWPVWVPLSVAAMEGRQPMRRLLYGIGGAGAALGLLYYLPLAAHFDDWVTVRAVHHSIRYDYSSLPIAQGIAGWVWAGLYLAAVCCPLALARDRHFRILGFAVAASAALSFVLFWYAFTSVWCFFAAVLSLYLGYAFYRLPRAATSGRR